MLARPEGRRADERSALDGVRSLAGRVRREATAALLADVGLLAPGEVLLGAAAQVEAGFRAGARVAPQGAAQRRVLHQPVQLPGEVCRVPGGEEQPRVAVGDE